MRPTTQMTMQMTKRIARWCVVGVVVALGASAGTALAQPGPGAAPPAAPAAPAAPAGAAAASPGAAGQPAPPPAPAAAEAPPGDARKACTAAMNADPKFAAEIVKIADEKAALERDRDTVAAHTDAVAHVQKNERHVIYAYAAMWIIAALFVIFLWRRQQGLQTEIAHLRRDLEAAGGEGPSDKVSS